MTHGVCGWVCIDKRHLVLVQQPAMPKAGQRCDREGTSVLSINPRTTVEIQKS